MTPPEPFYARQRLRTARAAVRASPRFAHDDVHHEALTDVFLDLVANLADHRPDDPDGARAFVLRTMGAIVRREARAIYKPHGYKNPFAPPPARPAPPPTPAPARPKWTWPVVEVPPASGGGSFDAAFREFSALKMFGYTVGVTDGWPQARREGFLHDFMTMDLPAEVARHFGDEYGAPMTSTRLRKVANVIASNARNVLRRSNASQYRVAIEQWESDLQYLKDTFYVGAGLRFDPWPSPRS